MLQVWLNRLWKLLLVVTLSITMLLPVNNVLADDFTSLIPGQTKVVSKNDIHTPIVLATLGESKLTLKSITSATSTIVTVKLQEANKSFGPIHLEAGKPSTLILDTCFSNLVNILLKDHNTNYIGRKTLAATALKPTSSTILDYGDYKINFEVNLLSCS